MKTLLLAGTLTDVCQQVRELESQFGDVPLVDILDSRDALESIRIPHIVYSTTDLRRVSSDVPFDGMQ